MRDEFVDAATFYLRLKGPFGTALYGAMGACLLAKGELHGADFVIGAGFGACAVLAAIQFGSWFRARSLA